MLKLKRRPVNTFNRCKVVTKHSLSLSSLNQLVDAFYFRNKPVGPTEIESEREREKFIGSNH